MGEENASYGTPATGASPSSNPILAQPPLADASTSEGMFSVPSPLNQPPLTQSYIITTTIVISTNFRCPN